MKIDAISPQNEPGQASSYPGLNLPVPAQAVFISRYLAPALSAAGLHPTIYAHDYKWLFADRAAALASDPAVARVLAGIAWHCYDGNPVVMTMQRLHVSLRSRASARAEARPAHRRS